MHSCTYCMLSAANASELRTQSIFQTAKAESQMQQFEAFLSGMHGKLKGQILILLRARDMHTSPTGFEEMSRWDV